MVRYSIVRWLTIGAVIYSICIVWTAVVSYVNYSEYIDVSYYHSFLQQLASWKLPFVWDTGISVWSQHLSLFLFLFVPFYWLGASQVFLVFIQATLAICASVPLYFFAKQMTKSAFVSIAVVWSYVLFGGIQSSIYYGFHEVTFFPLLLFSVLWMWSIKKYRTFILFYILMLIIKEEIAFIGICLGILFILLKQWKYALTAIVLGIVWYLISFGIISYFHHGGYEYWGQFLGSSWRVGLFDRKPYMLLETFGSFGFLPLFFLPNAVLLAPALGMKLLSSDITAMNSFHYSATFTGLLVASTVLSLTYVVGKKYRTFCGWFLLVVALVGNFYYGYGYYYGGFPRMTIHNIRIENFFIGEQSRERDRAIEMIPSGASVGCQYQLCSHIDRPYGTLYPIPGPVMPEYLIIDTSLPIPLKTHEEIRTFFTSEEFRGYHVVYRNGSVVLLRRNVLAQ